MKRTYQFSQFSWVLFLISTCLLMLMNSTPVQAAPELTVSNYELVSSMRITRTVFEYTYKADITNTGSDALDVSATLSVSAPGVTVLDSELSFGDVVAGATVKSSDTFVIRQDRQYSFAVDALQWEIKTKVTIEGIDSDGDGVRDDVQIAIANKYPSNTGARLALTQFAKALQHAYVAQNSNDQQQLNNSLSEIVSAANCITFSTPSPLEDIVLIEIMMANTKERFDVYEAINTAASGQFFGGEVDFENACQE